MPQIREKLCSFHQETNELQLKREVEYSLTKLNEFIIGPLFPLLLNQIQLQFKFKFENGSGDLRNHLRAACRFVLL